VGIQTKNNDLFLDTGYLSDVVLNWYGQSVEKLDLYAEAYHSAAKVLVENASEDQLRDIGACPVVFLYRLSLELWLKAILISGSKILELQGEDFETTEIILKKRHDLTKLLQAFKLLCTKLNWKWDAEHKALAAMIGQFHQIDRGSSGFRYPVDLSGEPALESGFRFDLRTLCAKMDETLLFLDQTDCGLARELDECQSNYQNA
jgi:hypothetical protein